jgi:magnesium-protoporphyrin O-methyltransferase
MPRTSTYETRRSAIETYFDRTAVDAWKALTSTAKVSGIRATVRAGRDQMRQTLLSWLPADMAGYRVLDAGCGTGMLASEAALRGASVVGADLSASLIEVARERTATEPHAGRLTFVSGDMLDAKLGTFDHVVAMDSLIHYPVHDMVAVLRALSARCRGSMVFTFAPQTALLSTMHVVGRLFPKSDRAPSIEPVSESRLRREIAQTEELSDWTIRRGSRVHVGFYISQAMELVRK